MNTDRSQLVLEEMRDTGHGYERRVIGHRQTFATTPDKLFPLLCPITEFDWMDGWHCEMIYSQSLVQEYNAIFRTDYFVPGEIWVISRFEPNRVIEFVRVSEHLSIKVDARVRDNLDGTCTGDWIVNITALTEQGNEALRSLNPDYEPIGILIDALDHYVKHDEIKALPDGIFNKKERVTDA